ncbi:RE1-silencing transcription factor [Thelohanellus kitauei]|uniref:RE1-silencing transcription factor n=1 Tax=Thelohanellus kitauei TaxID=669202 RepID=A0A0C2J0X8_THEKT|nr:RE1-silencing transcription factor [Thelohanellus kitauei]
MKFIKLFSNLQKNLPDFSEPDFSDDNKTSNSSDTSKYSHSANISSKNDETENNIIISSSYESDLPFPKYRTGPRITKPMHIGRITHHTRFRQYHILIKFEKGRDILYSTWENDEEHFKIDQTFSFIEESVKFPAYLFTNTVSYEATQQKTLTETSPLMKKKYICKDIYCSFASKEKAKLKPHYLYHCSIKPFKCNVSECYCEFDSRNAIIRHVGIHDIPRSCRCPFCKFVTSETYEMDEHLASHIDKDIKSYVIENSNDSEDI